MRTLRTDITERRAERREDTRVSLSRAYTQALHAGADSLTLRNIRAQFDLLTPKEGVRV